VTSGLISASDAPLATNTSYSFCMMAGGGVAPGA
jgi:hypothetical protein